MMNPPAGRKRISSWLRFLIWSAFGVLCLATLLVLTRWLVMRHGHQETLRITRTLREKPSAPVRAGSETANTIQKTAPGMQLADVPHFGQLLAGDEEQWQNFRKVLTEIDTFVRSTYRRDNKPYVDGGLSFRTMIQNMDGNVPESMTETEAAAEFLKRADRFSGLLAQWREAVAEGPMARMPHLRSDDRNWRYFSMSRYLSDLAVMTASAHLQGGDSTAAWSDLQLIKNSGERGKELYPLGYQNTPPVNYRVFNVAQSGIRLGTWTESQMAELSVDVGREPYLTTARKNMELSKQGKTKYYQNFRQNEDEFRKQFLKTPSQLNQFTNQVKLQLITDQQIEDNMALGLHRIDQKLSHFDPETGYYVQPTAAEKQAAEESSKPGLFGSYYFMIEDLYTSGDNNDKHATHVILQQAVYDQFRLSAALETHYRRTGSYPEHLASVSGEFPDGAPQDIATGQPYFYQREADGGYKLWSTGIDGKSDGGDDKNDVTWKQPARKK